MATVTMNQLMELRAFCEQFANQKLPLKTAYTLMKMDKQAQEELQWFQTEFQKIVQEYGMKDENGEFVSEEEGRIKIDPERVEECHAALEELENLEVSMDSYELSLDSFEGTSCTLAEMSAIMPFIE